MEKACCQYGYLKNFSTTCFLMMIKDNELKTFSKPHAIELMIGR